MQYSNARTIEFKGTIDEILDDHFNVICNDDQIAIVKAYLKPYNLVYVPRIGTHGVKVKFNPASKNLTKVSGETNLDYISGLYDTIVRVKAKCRKNTKRVSSTFSSTSISFIAENVDIVQTDGIAANLNNMKLI